MTFNCAINFTPLTSLQIHSNIRLSKTSQIFISFRTSIIRTTNITVPFLTFAIAAQATRFSRPEINILRISSSNFTDGRNHWRQPRRGRRGHIPPILLHTFGYSRPILVALRSLSLKPFSFDLIYGRSDRYGKPISSVYKNTSLPNCKLHC